MPSGWTPADPNLTSAIRQWLFARCSRWAIRGGDTQRRLSHVGARQEQRRLDQLQLHDLQLPRRAADDVDTGINASAGARRAPCASRSIAPSGGCRARSSPRCGCTPKSPLFGRLTIGVAERAIEQHERIFAFRRDLGPGTAGPSSAGRDSPPGSASPTQQVGAIAAAETGGLTTSAQPKSARARSVSLVQRLDRDGRTRSGCPSRQLGKIGLVAVPAQQGGRVDDRRNARLSAGRAAPATPDRS